MKYLLFVIFLLTVSSCLNEKYNPDNEIKRKAKENYELNMEIERKKIMDQLKKRIEQVTEEEVENYNFLKIRNEKIIAEYKKKHPTDEKIKLVDLNEKNNKTEIKEKPTEITIKDEKTNPEDYSETELIDTNGYEICKNEPLSTFSIDVDTASYSQLRKSLLKTSNINYDTLRIEEMINYFDYNYINPEKDLYSINAEVGPAYFSKDRYIMSIQIQGKKKEYKESAKANLVFLIDTSGSMDEENKMPLIIKGFDKIIDELKETDYISIVTYSEGTNILLENVSSREKDKIKKVINHLIAQGGTNGEKGLEEAYNVAKRNYITGGINRIIFCSDGDFNVGLGNTDALVSKIKEKKKMGINLSTIGFGMKTYNDEMMEQLANNGEGSYYYVDNYNEIIKVFSNELSSTFETIAKDVKIQVEFNPEIVENYRLIGYANKLLKPEDFNNDSKDAGEIGAGQRVTALYEIIFKDSKNRLIDKLKYKKEKNSDNPNEEFCNIKVRYKEINEESSKLTELAVFKKNAITDFEKTSNDFKFALSVAGFGEYLLKYEYFNSLNLNDIIKIAKEGKGEDKFGYKEEFIQLLEKYKSNLK